MNLEPTQQNASSEQPTQMPMPYAGDVRSTRIPELTRREQEALRYLAAGHSSDQIAGYLYISKQTVDAHRKNIIKKLRVANVTAAVAYALRNKIIL